MYDSLKGVSGGGAESFDEGIGQLYLFDKSLFVLLRNVEEEDVASLRVKPHIKLLAEKVRVLNFDQWLHVPVPQVDQADRVLISRHNVGQLGEGVWEERLQIGCVGVVAWVLNLHWFTLRDSVDNEDARLVPNTAEEVALGQERDLSHILATEDLVVPQHELVPFESAEVHSVAAAETELVHPVSLDYLVDVAS